MRYNFSHGFASARNICAIGCLLAVPALTCGSEWFHCSDPSDSTVSMAAWKWADGAAEWEQGETTPHLLGECQPDRSQAVCGWSAMAGAVALHRQRPNSALMFFNFFDETQGLNAASLAPGYKPAWELALARQLSDVAAVEFRYLGGDAWTARSASVTDASDPLVINARLPVFLTGGRTIDATYGADLDSFELNLRATPRNRVTWLVGVRHLTLNETFGADLIDSAGIDPTVAYWAATRNSLYGGQVGADATLVELGPRLRLDLSGKAGVFGNNNGQHSYLDTGLVRVRVDEGANSTAFLGEAHAALVYNLTGGLSLRLSYGLLWLTNVALATEQLRAASFYTRDGIHDTSDVFYHGGFVGMQYGY